MENKIMARQIIDFHKATFDNTLKALTIMQEQAEKMLQIFLLHNDWISADGRKVISDWVSMYKQGRTDFKDRADENFKKVEEYFAKSEAAPKAKAAKK
jgi:hypothetical protein